MSEQLTNLDSIRIYAETNDGLTSYQIAKWINVLLTEAGLDEIKPQMIYNYDRNGLIAKNVKQVTKTRPSGKYTYSEAETFVNKFVTKRTGVTKTDTSALEQAARTELLGL